MHQEKGKTKKCRIKFLMKFTMLTKAEVLQLKKKKIHTEWQSQTKLLHISGGNKLCLELIP